MKGMILLVKFMVLQLIAFNEGIRSSNTSVATGRGNRKPGKLKSCPRNSKLEALRKALGLVTKRAREKRGVSYSVQKSVSLKMLHMHT